MQGKLGALEKARYYTSLGALYAATVLLAWYLLRPAFVAQAQPVQAAPIPAVGTPVIIFGKPVRVYVPRLGLDLPVVDGAYNASDGSWTLSSRQAHFAIPSSLANDYAGNTFIYGHNNPHVFGPLKRLVVGDELQVFTDNGRTFFYRYEAAEDVEPDNVAVFSYEGTPTVTLQTCSGSWDEWRRLYRFRFERVDHA